MSAIPTVAVRILCQDAQGKPWIGAQVRATLTVPERYLGLDVPASMQGQTDKYGVVVLDLFPSELGSEGSVYNLTATIPQGGSVVRFVAIPNTPCDIVLGPRVTTSMAVQAAVEEVLAAREEVAQLQAEATFAASEADGSAEEAAEAASQAAASQAAAAVSAASVGAEAAIATTRAAEATTAAGTATAAATSATAKANEALASAGAASTLAIAAAASAASVPGNVAVSVAYLEAIAALVAGGSVAGVPAPIFAWAPALTPVLHPRVVFSRASISSFWGRSGSLRYAAANVPVFECDPLTGVCKGLVPEKSSTQDLLYSEQLENIKFIKARCSVVPNAKVYPDGSTGDKLVEDTTASNSHAILQHRTVAAGTQQCVYAIVSVGERTDMSISVYGGTSGYLLSFDFVAKAYALTPFGQGASSPLCGVQELHDGRFLLWISFLPATGVTDVVSQISITDATGNPIYTGDGISGIYVQSFGSCTGSFPPSYLPTGWETTSATSATVGTGAKTFSVGYDSTVPGRAIPAGATVRAWQTSNPAVFMAGTVTSHTGTTLVINVTSNGGGGTTASDWTIQAGAAVTRAADICTVPLSSLVGSAGEALWTGLEGMLVVQAITAMGRPAAPGYQTLVQLDDGTADNRILIYRDFNGSIRYVVDSLGVRQVDVVILTLPDATEFRLACVFMVGHTCIAVNGETKINRVLGAMPSGLTTKRLGCGSLGGSQWCGPVKLCNLYNRAPADEKVLALSAMEIPDVAV